MGSSTAATVTVTQGSYDSSSIITALTTAFSNAALTATVAYSTTTFKLTITLGSNWTLLIGSSFIDNIANTIGFTAQPSLATAQTGDSAINLEAISICT